MTAHVSYGLWEARKIDGRWCVGRADGMRTLDDAAFVLNAHDGLSDGVLAMYLARALGGSILLPPPYGSDAPDAAADGPSEDSVSTRDPERSGPP